jgi:hypothetical protein
VIDAGAEPRLPLRIRVPKGQKEKGQLKATTKTHTGASQQNLDMTMAFEVQANDTTPERDVRYEMVLGAFGLDMGQAAGSSVKKAMDEALDSLRGATVTGAFSERGRSRGMEIRLPDGASPLVKDTLERTFRELKDFGPPFLPEEPVGLGGRWQVTSQLTLNGMTMDVVAVYTLKAREKDRLDLELASTETAAPQPVSNPALPAGTSVELVSSSGTSSGLMQYDLTRLLPTKSTTKGPSKMVMKITSGKTVMDQTTETQVEMTLSSEVVPATTPAGSGSGGK